MALLRRWFLLAAAAAVLLFPAFAAAQTCPAGQVIALKTMGHCCWPGQSWAPTGGACAGAPHCPAGFVAQGTTCAAPPPPVAPPVAAPPPPAAKPATDTKDEGREHFEKGLTLFDEEAWDAALVEFLRSRELRPTKGATKNAAICLRKLKRFDEALDMFEELLKFPNLPAPDRELGEREVKTLLGLVGEIDVKGAESGATIAVDGRSRGVTPSPPLRVSTGTHTVRVYKEGYEAYETRVDVVGGRTTLVQAHLIALTQSGRLLVTETTGKVFSVVVDNTVAGTTPWDGTLAPGEHTVFLRGMGDVGTQPASVRLKLNETQTLALTAETLPGQIDVRPMPAGATVTIDGATVARGQWSGRLRVGPHRVDVKMDGFAPQTRQVSLTFGTVELVEVQLEREGGRIFVEADLGMGVAPSLGGTVGGCAAPCSPGFGLGVMGIGHAGYRFASGWLVEAQAGYLLTEQGVRGRPETATPTGEPPNKGTATDTLTLSGPMFGAAAGYRLGRQFSVLFRLGAGAYLGTIHDHRTAMLTNSTGEAYTVDTAAGASATSFYVAPEVRAGMRIGKVAELSVGVQAFALFATGQPTWPSASNEFIAAPAGQRGDGEAQFAADPLTGKVMLVVVPGVGARFEF